MNKRKKFKEKRKQKLENFFERDETFAFIAGYTSNGVPHGITHEEMEEIEKNNSSSKDELDDEIKDLF